jgi:hypothetical protein
MHNFLKQKHHVIMTTKSVYSSLATGLTNEEIGFNFWEQTRNSALLQSAVTRLGPNPAYYPMITSRKVKRL